MSEKHWIKSAIKHHGIFHKEAQAAGMSTEAFATKHEHSAGLIGHRARLAKTLMHLNHHDESQTPEAKFNQRVDESIKNHKKP